MTAEQIMTALGIHKSKHADPEYMKDAIERLWRAITEDDRLLHYLKDTYSR